MNEVREEPLDHRNKCELKKKKEYEIYFHCNAYPGLHYQHIYLLRNQICQLLFPIASRASYFQNAICNSSPSIW